MITTDRLTQEIDELARKDMSWPNVERLNLLLSARRGLEEYYGDHRKERDWACRDHIDMATAMEWVMGMRNNDGSTGPHWTMDQTTQVLQQRGWNCEPAEFYAVINSLWSDYGKTAQKYGVDKIDYWADMAHDWLDDKDARQDKAARYYKDIVEH